MTHFPFAIVDGFFQAIVEQGPVEIAADEVFGHPFVGRIDLLVGPAALVGRNVLRQLLEDVGDRGQGFLRRLARGGLA